MNVALFNDDSLNLQILGWKIQSFYVVNRVIASLNYDFKQTVITESRHTFLRKSFAFDL